MSNKDKILAKVIAGIIFDRKFDIPDSLYKYINELVLIELIDKMNTIDYKLEYEINKEMQAFIKKVRKMLFDKDEFYERVVFNFMDIFWLLLFFNENDWNITKEEIDDWETDILIEYIAQSLKIPDIEDTTKWLLNIFKEYHKDNVEDMITELTCSHKFSIPELVKVSYMMGWNKNFNTTLILLGNRIPILYSEYCIETLYLYIKVVLESEYRGELDPNIEEQLYTLNNELLTNDYDMDWIGDSLKEIGITLNHNNLKYTRMFIGNINFLKKSTEFIETIENTKNAFRNSFGYKIKAGYRLKNFKDIIWLLGNNPVGYPIDIQMYFISIGGDMSTVFDNNGKLLPEFSILKFNDYLSTLIVHKLNFTQLQYLLYHSPEFVKNILLNINQLEVKGLIDIAKAFLTLPIDIKLWNSLNFKGDDEIDFRATIISKIIDILSLEVLYNNVPETMAYIEPSILYMVKNIKNENIQFAPVHKIEPYLRPHMGKNSYTRYNLFVNGKYVSLQSAINDYKFLIDIIVKNGKFGYICDLDTNIDEVIDKVVNLIAIESEVNK